MSSDFEVTLMKRALEAALQGTRAVRPNPKVGCAILPQGADPSTGVVVGHHAQWGGPHAEIEALRLCQERGLSTRGATLAVTLEPCSHQGRTPPCVEALLASGVSRVIVASEDPNPIVQGRGLARLREAGIEVMTGVLQSECEQLNREWLHAHRRGRPFVTLKMATSLDGAWVSAAGESQWITSASARDDAHRRYRSRVDALLTGRATVVADAPRFTVRTSSVEPPPVVVVGRATHFDLSPYSFAERGNYFCLQKDSDLKTLLQSLYAENRWSDLLVEGGPRLASLLLEQSLVDEVALYLGARFLGGPEASRLNTLAGGKLPGLPLKLLELVRFEDSSDLLLRLCPQE